MFFPQNYSIREKIETIIFLLISIVLFFTSTTILLKTIDLFRLGEIQTLELPTWAVLSVVPSLLYVQLLIAYGFAYKKYWLVHILALHSTYLGLLALVVLPIMNISGHTISTLVHCLMWTGFTILVWQAKIMRTQQFKKANYFVLLTYTVALLTIIAIQIKFFIV